MSEQLTALEVCCCGACEVQGHPKEVIRPLTAEEIAQREVDAAAYAAAQAEAEAAAAAKQAEKEAIAARLGLSVDELKTLLS
jgi:hypothetical protein